MRSNSLACVLVVVVVLLLLAGAIFFLASRNRPPASTPPPVGGGEPISDIAKPKPVTQTFHGCPPSGDGGDPVLNTLKNRVDEGAWHMVTVSSLLALTWPQERERQSHSRWSRANAAEI